MLNIEQLEKRLWNSADQLRSNADLASNEYFIPIMGIIFLRHAFNRYLQIEKEIEPTLAKRGGKPRPLAKEDFFSKAALFLREKSRFDYLANLPGDKDKSQAIINAMQAIEEDYESLRGILPKDYHTLSSDLLGNVLRVFNDPELEKAGGDVFGHIYQYFLFKFANQKAHDNGEFFTPTSLVRMIVDVIEPDHGKIIDPACGSGGMFAQTGHFLEQAGRPAQESVTFYGQEKNQTTIRLAKMNLAVHGLEGNIIKGITYYEDHHDMLGKADFVMANPPFNVDEVDAEKIKGDPRLPFGLPGVNKKGAVSNGNYLWISYFYSYLNEKGRAEFVMSSQASSAGKGEMEVRRRIVETGHVDVMMAIRSNFFYIRTVPCELWFFDKAKPKALRDKVLMIDARNVYRKVTRKVNDFSPEQAKNLTAIVWLYRGQEKRFLKLVAEYLDQCVKEAIGTEKPLKEFLHAVKKLISAISPFLKNQKAKGPHAEPLKELTEAVDAVQPDAKSFQNKTVKALEIWKEAKRDNAGLLNTAQKLAPLAEESRDLVKQADLIYKLAARLVEICEKELEARKDEAWPSREVAGMKRELEEGRKEAVEQLKRVRYFYKQVHWLQERFPEAKLANVEGLVKLVDRKEIEANDWSLTPGRYVGVAPEEVDEDFDFEEALRDIHVELTDLNAEAEELAKVIARNFEELGV